MRILLGIILIVIYLDGSILGKVVVTGAKKGSTLLFKGGKVAKMVKLGMISSSEYTQNRTEHYLANLKNTFNRLPTGNEIRRITRLEKNLISSGHATKQKIFGRTVVKRKIFQCNQKNISLMLKGNSPFGFDNKRVELHHLKQQKNGSLIELTQTEHNQHSKVLHRYVKNGSEITDRKSGFSSFRNKYWKSRALDCIARRK